MSENDQNLFKKEHIPMYINILIYVKTSVLTLL